MPQYKSMPWRFQPSLPFVLLCLLLSILWLAGGASRGDVAGQIIVRAAAWTTLTVAIIFARPPSFSAARPIALLLLASLALALVQLVPLPPAIWQALPDRELLTQAATLSGQPQPWRPWSIVPGATVNAASALIVPVTTLLLLMGLDERERLWLPGLLLGLVTANMLAGLLQVSGAGFDNPLVNDTIGEVSGMFANRNHYALFMAFGCVLAPAWAFQDERRPRWRGPVALGLMLLFALTILASGSRAGLGLGLVGLALGLLLAQQGIKRALRRYPPWVFPVLMAGVVGILAMFVLISIATDRAVSINRAAAIDLGKDMRTLGFPTVVSMIRAYFPWGAGLGSFDTAFRIHEPFHLLKPSYFNHAHDDLLEIVLDAGLPGLSLLLAALLWWGWASVKAWRAGAGGQRMGARLGSAMLLLLIVASIFDYPVRTPMMMAIVIIAGVWLGGHGGARAGSALPANGHHL